ncbi:hypothetical protein [uncultured Roseovarius sp.]|uniref:hypothetical protein n=1 Tax=uncultured Roseovarius sp. TaxID=293344 RepID=UPI00260E3D04|nr:hypothetical protein [uncultured Roseovarius sp.]
MDMTTAALCYSLLNQARPTKTSRTDFIGRCLGSVGEHLSARLRERKRLVMAGESDGGVCVPDACLLASDKQMLPERELSSATTLPAVGWRVAQD